MTSVNKHYEIHEECPCSSHTGSKGQGQKIVNVDVICEYLVKGIYREDLNKLCGYNKSHYLKKTTKHTDGRTDRQTELAIWCPSPTLNIILPTYMSNKLLLV